MGYLGNMRYIYIIQRLHNERNDILFLYTCSSKDKTDLDVIKENHKFLWDDEEADTW